VRSVASICLLACLATTARGDELTLPEQQIVSLAVDFCGGMVGETPGASVAASQKIPGLKLSAAKPIKDWTADEKARNGIRAGLAKSLDDPLQFAAFSDDPGIDSKPGAMFAIDESACSASGTARHDVFDAIGTRMNADTRWKLTEHTDNPRTATWHRTTATGGEVVFMLSNVDLMTFNRVISNPPPTTPASARPLVKSVAEICVNGVLEGADLDVRQFATQFYPYKRVDGEGRSASLRSFGSLPRAMVNTSSFRKEFYCELSMGTGEGNASAEDLRAMLIGAIGEISGVKATSDHEWRVQRKGKSKKAALSLEVDPRGLIALEIKTHGGHF
jgi:hypothetical protein